MQWRPKKGVNHSTFQFNYKAGLKQRRSGAKDGMAKDFWFEPKQYSCTK